MKILIPLLVLTTGLLTSCSSSFTNGYVDGNIKKLDNNTIQTLSGKYKIYAEREYRENGNSKILDAQDKKTTLYSRLNNEFPNIKNLTDLERFIRDISLDSEYSGWLSTDYVEADFTKNNARFRIIKEGKEYMTANFQGKIKNGFFVFKTENNCVEIPIVLSGCSKVQRRVGLSVDNDLIVQQISNYNLIGARVSSVLKQLGNNLESAYGFKKTE